MNRLNLSEISVNQLVEQFVKIALDQDRCIQLNDNDGYAALYQKMSAIETELKARNGDARTALLQLYDHPNIEVRLKAARATLAVAPQQARKALEAIRVSKFYPAALDAGMAIRNLDDGIYKPE
jgi:hypothetical protein